MGVPLSLRSISVRYGATPVLAGVSLEVAAGEFVALLGASGCGKTTLLRVIAGFVTPSAGAVFAGDSDITRLPPERRGTAMVFQSYALWPHLDVARTIGYGLTVRGWPRERIARRVADMLTLLRLEGLERRLPRELSGGQRQRVALGRALAIDPAILLLDEPMSNLDARVREGLRHELRALQRGLGITAIHVTHDREEAMVMADRIVVLDRGRIAQVGTPEELWTRPASPFVADFLGATNRLPVVLGADGALRVGEAPIGRYDRASFRPGDYLLQFRPEEVRAGEAAGEAGLRFAAHLRHAAYAGGRWRASLDVAGHEVLVDLPAPAANGTRLDVHLPPAAAHLFARTPEPA